MRLADALRGQAIPPAVAVVRDADASTTACPICKGAQWVRHNVPVGDPMFGRATACDCLQAERARWNIRSLEHLSALDAFRNRTFENFDPKVRGAEEAYQIARDYARDPYGWLVLHGGVGCGKTHLAAAIANHAVKQLIPVLFAVVPDLLDHLRATYAPTSTVQYDEMFEGVRSTQLLVLDDLGTESSTPWAQEKLYQLVNYRYNYRMPTVFTTNRRIDSLDDRIRSRLGDQALCKLLEITAKDFRELKAGQRRPGTPGAAVDTPARTPSRSRTD
ncbi:MAG TPA: ATP-binding protein [Chloroflexota bacterium]|nr:ATP-binding protein [Chloroflexota bacterium]